MRKLSLVITFHAYKHYLKECFASLSDSLFKDFEVILIMDHVEENVNKLIASYQKKLDIKVYELQEGQGVAAARNMGIEKSSGEYVYFLDSDDYLREETLSILIDQMEHHADVVYGKIHNTWNNKANYLEKQMRKDEELSEEDLEERLLQKEEHLENYLQSLEHSEGRDKDIAIYHLIKKRKGFRSISALGNAYRKAFLLENDIVFDSQFTYYSDILFLVQVLEKATTFAYAEESIYVKRKHNDPINYPALQQIEDDDRFYERMRMFQKVRELCRKEGRLHYLMERKMVNYCVYNFGRKLRRSMDSRWRNEYFPMLSNVMKDCDPKAIRGMRLWKRRMMKAIQNNDLSKTLKLVRRRLAKKKFVAMLKNKNVFYKTAYYHIFMKKPLLENVVMFETFMGKNYSDSPKYIFEYLAKHHSDKFQFVWVLNNKTTLPYNAKVVKRFSFRYAYYLARAKYLVFNVRQPLWYRKKEGQVFVETWHGTPLKRLVFDQKEVTAASPKYKKEFYKQRQDWDYLVSANDFSTETLSRCFMFEKEMLDVGYPRNDILYAEDKEERALALKKKLHIPLDKKTILYAPTWRDDEHYGKGQYKFTLHLDLKMMKEKLSDEYVVLLRTHHYIADAIDTSGLEGFTYNLSKYDDISEIYLISDICITDYSSVFFDYANLKRPILFYTYDIDKYRDQLRGFYIDMESEVPGPLLYTSEEVVDAILHIEDVNETYATRYETFYQRFCHLDDGNASKRIAERVFLK